MFPTQKTLCFTYTTKNYHLFKVVENRMQQCCAAHIVDIVVNNIVQRALIVQPAIRYNAENIVDNYKQFGQHNIVESCF